MIVSIGQGEDGIHVCIDDEIKDYNPLRTVELCNTARKLFAETYMEVLIANEPTVPADDLAAE